ncbi:MAG: Holliday junction resolvase Hjc [Candidatus Nanoarchaeia archaeon]|nr:Holliday junction resolvase Hjc [Candidatus Haiyanarchaeum thermophilum]MCW1302973.1 Holliday junction resolvase Hjc [Candidatus Haiyanarchaeum thermophilum]MCW1303651.1 Holliday junction resolvase Hjc [Candidatus Haiyanarchaeum thermophilum]MCW1306332.1 Holliday junction resolvase Hjc [Candidatus Haiyanarchaeum thermophilum]MCW1307158.1 Holliday junction resolvase Hjc [Candidatus Haiyanarchaeum thermophilum]
MVRTYKKGSEAERELMKLLWKHGIGAVRVAGSGKAKSPTCDLVIGKSGKILVVECKSTKKDAIYLEEDEVEKIRKLAEVWGCEALIGCRFARSNWFFLKLNDIYPSRKINRLDSEKENAMELSELINYFEK